MAEVDFRVGGRYRFAMTGPDGKQNDPFGGEYLEIVPNERLVLTDAFEAPGNDPMRWTVTFAETDGKTTMTVHILFWSKEMKDQYLGYGMMEGAASSFDQLGTLVERLAKEGAR
jgi:uncharacterized protein YndB with AHSA1/START domain